MFKGKKEIQIVQYEPESVKKAGVRLAETGNVHTFSFSVQKLTIALARTILSMNPKDMDLIYQAISSYSALYPLISDDAEFRFRADVDLKIRDYILSTRTGEIAPAMGYLFAQEQLEKPFIVDFASLLHDESVKIAAPDLIAFSLEGDLSFIESKGSKDMRNKGKLRDALLQSENAAPLLNMTATDFYGAFISIPKADADYSAAIHYTHTVNEQEQRHQEDMRSLVYKHYASWFMLLGFYEAAASLANSQPITMKKPKNKTVAKKQKYYLFETKDSLFFRTLQVWDQSFKRIQLGITEDVFAFLTGQEGAPLALPPLHQVRKQGSKYDLFADGTVIFYK